MMREMILRRWTLLIYLICFFLFACGDYQKEVQYNEETYDRFGAKFNPVRKKARIPLLPRRDWKPSRVVFNGPDHMYGECDFEKDIPISQEEREPYHARKEIYFFAKDRTPIREIDVYHSGKKYIEGDPDYFGWERLELSYDFTSDTLAGYSQSYIASNFLLRAEKGQKRAYLVSPVSRMESSNGSSREWVKLQGRQINLWQADSVLIAWGL